MSELTIDNDLVEPPVPAPAPVPSEPGVGALLRQAREARQLSVGDVAQILKISYRQVEALEEGNWAALPGQTFVLGFVRNYARFLRLDGEALLRRIKAERAPEAPHIVLTQVSTAPLPDSGRGKRRDRVTVAGAALIVGGALAAYFLVPADFTLSFPEIEPAAEVSQGDTAKEAQPAFPPPSAEEPAVLPAGAVPLPAALPASGEAVPAPSAVTAGESPVAGEGTQARFSFRFEQPSWVEVKDKSGQIVFSQLNPAGSEREVAGQPPFSLIVGNASHVKLTYRGKEVPLEPRSKEDVARVTLD